MKPPSTIEVTMKMDKECLSSLKENTKVMKELIGLLKHDSLKKLIQKTIADDIQSAGPLRQMIKKFTT